jgi:uncharacterized membrane protein
MTLREVFGIVALVVMLQLCLGVMMYALAPTTGLELSSIAIAIAVMIIIAGSIAAVLVFLFKRYASERTARVALMTLTEDERKVFDAIVRAGGEARQDKLRRELDMSKSKLSALVNNLERKHAITKARYFKTNILRVSKEFRGGFAV